MTNPSVSLKQSLKGTVICLGRNNRTDHVFGPPKLMVIGAELLVPLAVGGTIPGRAFLIDLNSNSTDWPFSLIWTKTGATIGI